MWSWVEWKERLASLRDFLLTPFGAVWAGLKASPAIAIFSVVLATLVVHFYKAPLLDFFNHAEDGKIIVNSPTVYTRQRLVNDRLDQARWLRTQLEITESANIDKFKMIDQMRENNAFTKIDAGGAGTSQNSDKNTSSSPSIEATTTAIFRAKNAYREEVRSELTQTELDDRHDIRGNTIFRLTFDASIIAGTRRDSIAAVAVQLSHHPEIADESIKKIYNDDYESLYSDWVRYVQETIRKSLGTLPASIMSRNPVPQLRTVFSEFLLRRICQFADKNPNLEMLPVPCDDKKRAIATALLIEFAAMRKQAVIDYKRRTFLSLLDGFKAAQYIPDKYNYEAGYYSAAAKCAAENRTRIALWEIGAPPKNGQANTDLIPCPFYETVQDGLVSGILLYERLYAYANDSVAATGKGPQPIEDVARSVSCDQGDCDVQPDRLKCFSADFIKSNLNSFHNAQARPEQRIEYYLQLKIVGREVDGCNLAVLQRTEKNTDGDEKGQYIALSQLKKSLNYDTDAFAYSVTPKNLTENISTAAETRDAFELLFHTQVDRSEIAKFLRDRSAKNRSVVTHPIVVGFGSPSRLVDPGSHVSDRAVGVRDIDFGWIIAAHSLNDRDLEQIDGQYPLTAFISVPSWWQTVVATIKTCWLSRADFRKAQPGQSASKLCADDFGADAPSITVRLPAAIPEVSRKLGFEVIQQPSLYKPEPKELVVGQRGALLLQGQRLWRSTEVTAGAQRADKITVLPNMEGIIAEFTCVRPPAGQRTARQNIDVNLDNGQMITSDFAQVWTSEGVTEAIPVIFVWPNEGVITPDTCKPTAAQ
jgi:hypothetical protein